MDVLNFFRNGFKVKNSNSDSTILYSRRYPVVFNDTDIFDVTEDYKHKYPKIVEFYDDFKKNSL